MALRLLLSQTLIPKSAAPLLPLASVLRARPSSSSSSEDAHVVEIDLGETEGDQAAGARLLEDAIHRVVVRRSAPAWLPFLPGSSYWVPPRRSLQSHPGMAHLIGRIANPLTEEELISLRSVRGCPSSDFFIQGLLPNPIEDSPEKNNVKNDSDEET